MILDTSALLAVLFDEVDADDYEHTIGNDAMTCRRCQWRISLKRFWSLKAAWVKKVDGSLTTTCETAEIELVSVTPEQVQAARLAWRRFGKGNHPAGLNFGDCFAYAR